MLCVTCSSCSSISGSCGTCATLHWLWVLHALSFWSSEWKDILACDAWLYSTCWCLFVYVYILLSKPNATQHCPQWPIELVDMIPSTLFWLWERERIKINHYISYIMRMGVWNAPWHAPNCLVLTVGTDQPKQGHLAAHSWKLLSNKLHMASLWPWELIDIWLHLYLSCAMEMGAKNALQRTPYHLEQTVGIAQPKWGYWAAYARKSLSNELHITFLWPWECVKV